jgi:hypothetical protein
MYLFVIYNILIYSAKILFGPKSSASLSEKIETLSNFQIHPPPPVFNCSLLVIIFFWGGGGADFVMEDGIWRKQNFVIHWVGQLCIRLPEDSILLACDGMPFGVDSQVATNPTT